jgi:signal transduction histidine kinase
MGLSMVIKLPRVCTMKTELLHFDVSTGLKSVLGSELITDDEVAIFELVKNSFDADARHVDLFFGDEKIVISDNGLGMTLEEIKSKWLFVAYSSKRNATKSNDFRHEIGERKHYAGSKGVGRFSSDRLGQIVVLQTRPKKEKTGPVHRVTVDWDLFDKDHKDHFEAIDVSYIPLPNGFEFPPRLRRFTHGTIISIEKTRRIWDRKSILRLKSALAKLINPFGASSDGFTIAIHSPSELSTDKKEIAQAKSRSAELSPNALVNGEVGNFIFETLQAKTTFIDVRVDSTGKFLESSLTDRGELIYRIREPNEYRLLAKSEFSCQIYFLNTSAKLTFSRRMGVPSVQFGSVFLFRNGFRVFPVGEEGDDWFGMDRRKQQGYKRFLGTRDVIGRIDVSGADRDFKEASSRNTGLIETAAVAELRECFAEHCLKRIERYVVPVTFVDTEDRNSGDISRLMTDPGRARVASAVAKLVDNDKIELLEYSQRLIGILDERSAEFESSLVSLRAIAEKSKDRRLFKSIEEAEKRFEELRRSEEAARQQADEERAGKEAAQARAAEAEEQLVEEKKRNLFLISIASLDSETILNLHHQVTIYAANIQQQIENFIVAISGHKSVSTSEVINAFEGIALLNRKVMGISKFATKANFRLESEMIKADLADFIEQYVNGVASDFLVGNLSARVDSDGKGFTQKFKPIDVSVVVDNLITNAKKAKATQIKFEITHPTKTTVHIVVSDNGRGFHQQITELSRVFEKGYTMTDGSGLGLYHIKHVLGEMNGTIEAQRVKKSGAVFIIKISK